MTSYEISLFYFKMGLIFYDIFITILLIIRWRFSHFRFLTYFFITRKLKSKHILSIEYYKGLEPAYVDFDCIFFVANDKGLTFKSETPFSKKVFIPYDDINKICYNVTTFHQHQFNINDNFEFIDKIYMNIYYKNSNSDNIKIIIAAKNFRDFRRFNTYAYNKANILKKLQEAIPNRIFIDDSIF